MVKDYYGESIRIKTSRRESPEDRIQGTSRCRAFGCLLVVEQYKEGLLLPAVTWTTCMEYCQPGNLIWTLVYRIFIGAQSHRHSWPLTWLTLVSNSCMIEPTSSSPKSLIINHIVIKAYQAARCHQINKDTLIRQEINTYKLRAKAKQLFGLIKSFPAQLSWHNR